jgi:hypothetical protein
MGVGLTRLRYGINFNTINLLGLSQFLVHVCKLVLIAILILGVGFPLYELHNFYIQIPIMHFFYCSYQSGHVNTFLEVFSS